MAMDKDNAIEVASTSIFGTEVDFRTYCDENIPVWKSWVSQGKVQEAIDQLMALEKRSRIIADNVSTTRISVAIVDTCFEAKNWLALNEQIVLLSNRRSQPKRAIIEMVQECLTYIEKIPDKNDKFKLIETLSFVTEGKTYLNEEKTKLLSILAKIKKEENNTNEPVNNIEENVVQAATDTDKNEKVVRRKPLCSQSKEILYNLHNYFKALNDKSLSRGTAPKQLVSTSTGIPLTTVRRVILEGKYINEGSHFTSSKRSRKKGIPIDNFDKALIRETIIENYCNVEKDIPPIHVFLENLKNKVKYSGSLSSLRTEVSRLGFKRKIIEGPKRSKMLVEKHEVRFLCINFLVKITEYRAQGRPIVYTGETDIDSLHLLKTPAGNGILSVVHAGGMSGCISHALNMLANRNREGTDPCATKNEDYMKWMKCKLIPNLKPNSVIIVENAPYLNIFKNSAPSPYARKREMLDWLSYRNIVHSPSMLKPQLYQLILQSKNSFNEYKIDSLLRESNHTVLRLPPYHPKLNPIQDIWEVIKGVVAKKKGSMSTKSVMKIVEEQMNAIPVQEWRKLCDLAIQEEKKIAEHEAAIDALTERLDSNVSDSSDDSYSEDDVTSMSECD